MSDFALRVIGDIGPYTEAVSKIPGITEKQVAKASLDFIRESSKAQAAALKNAESAATKGAATAKKAWEDGFRGIAEAARGTGHGAVAEQVDHLAKAYLAVGKDGLTAAAGTAAAAAPLAALGAAAVAVVAGVGLVGAGLVEAGLHAKEAQEDLKGFALIGSSWFPKVPPDAQQGIDALAASGSALTAVFDRFVVNVGSNVAPSLAKVADLAVGVAVSSEQWFESWDKGRSLVGDFTGYLVDSMRGPVDAYRQFLKATVAVEDAIGISVPDSVRESAASFEGFRANVVSTVEDVTSLGGSLSHYVEVGRDFITTTERANKALKDQSQAAKDAAEAARKLDEQRKKNVQDAEKEGDALRQADLDRAKAAKDGLATLQEAGRKAAESWMSAEDQVKAQADDAIEAQRRVAQAVEDATGAGSQEAAAAWKAFEDARVDVSLVAGEKIRKIHEDEAKKATAATYSAVEGALNDVAGLAQTVTSAEAASVHKLEDELNDSSAHYTEHQKAQLERQLADKRRGAQTAWDITQGARLAEAVVSGAAATVSAYNDGLAVGGPTGLVLGPVMAGVAAGAAAVEVAAIAAEQPSFLTGGFTDPYASPTGIPSTLHPREAVLNEGGRETIGDETIRAANGRRPLARSVPEAVVKLRHHVYDDFFLRYLRADNALTRSIRGTGVVGHADWSR